MRNYLDENTLDSLLEGFQLIDFNWRYIYINKTVAEQGKSSKKELLGHTMMEKFPGIENTEMFRALQRCMNERISHRIENEFTYPDGTKGWFELRIEPVSEGLFILSVDISEQKKVEEELRKLNESLEVLVTLRTAELSIKNKDLTDSIKYAQRIQCSKLPSKKEIYSVFPNSFILFKPKDIVSGDFYYFHKSNQSVFIASADCTGHGVPGALMSMLCSEKLNEAVLKGSGNSEILKQLNKSIKTSLRQSSSDDSIRDGMDIALCSVDTINSNLKYAGANRPLWIIRNGHTELEEIKSTKNAIGGFTDDSQHFDTQEIKLQQGDTFYIFTDGYADTFGGQDGKKLTTKKFKEILLDIQHKTMQEQEEHLNNFIENWKAGIEQVDDILVIGIRL